MTRTAIIAAFPAELRHIVRGWQHERHNGVDTWSHRDDNLYVAACAGAGQQAATRAFAAVEESAPIDLVFSVGWAGALTAGLEPASAHNVAGVIDATTGERFRCDAGAGPLWLATSPRVADHAEKLRLASTYSAALVDMEAAAMARLAAMRGIPFYCIKGVSDGLTDRLPDLNRFLTPSGQLQMPQLILFALFRPIYWPALLRMGDNSRMASQSIADTLRDFLDE
jgi:adenosylhomocysteine nucleosidase